MHTKSTTNISEQRPEVKRQEDIMLGLLCSLLQS